MLNRYPLILQRDPAWVAPIGGQRYEDWGYHLQHFPKEDRAVKSIFVFGSNEAGIHGAGAAKEARLRHGAILGKGLGHHGNSFAIPTKDGALRTLPIACVRSYVEYFLKYAKDNPQLTFQVTCIGCGLAGFRHEQIAPLFQNAPDNCLFDRAWQPWLPFQAKFWGTF